MNALKVIVIVMGLLIMVGAGVVVVTIINRIGGSPEETAAAPAAAPAAPAVIPRSFTSRDLDLPAGTRIVATTADDGRLYIHVRLAGGAERVLVIDPGTGATLGTLSVPASP